MREEMANASANARRDFVLRGVVYHPVSDAGSAAHSGERVVPASRRKSDRRARSGRDHRTSWQKAYGSARLAGSGGSLLAATVMIIIRMKTGG